VLLGIALALCAAMGFAGSAVFAKKGMSRVAPPFATAVLIIPAAMVTLALAFIFHWSIIFGLSGGVFLWFLLIGFINYPGGRLMNNISINAIGPSKSAIIVSSSPIFAAIFAVAFAGESLNKFIVIGTVAIMSGVILVVTDR
jgi:drug/metabolite transporter (DMT)-like permease|tara:strand:+ start:33 stop:458 length:426 start_codon:yes stop_codon:yes gene_type:complete